MTDEEIIIVARTFQAHSREIEAIFLARECYWDEQFLRPDDLRTIIDGNLASDAEKETARKLLCGESITTYSHQPYKAKREKETKGYVYVLRADNGTYKIGMSKDIESRVKLLTVKLPYELELVTAIETDDMYSLESELHEYFADKRLRGEWFSLSPQDIETIKSMGGENGDINQ